jgi:hypothetical protein
MDFSLNASDAIRFLLSCGYTRQQAEELVYSDDPSGFWGF